MRTITVTTRIPSPYQVELFDAVAASGYVDIRVLYEMRRSKNRSWASPNIAHEHAFLEDLSFEKAQNYLSTSDLVVFSGYQNPTLRRLISDRHASGKLWAFWGERPGFVIPQWIGRHYRRLWFPQIHASNAPIWGVGQWAVEAYQRELGAGRVYCNVPYHSRLSSFLAIDRSGAGAPPKRILFSGSLIKRKGIDLLMRAFLDIAPEMPSLELHVIGDGPLRKQLEETASALSDRVYFHGFQQWSQLAAYYAAADVLCAPSRYDGWGLIVPEGLAAGLLVIGTDQTGAALELVDESTGWLVKAGALGPLRDALRQVGSTTGEERVSRIVRGRKLAVGKDVSAGVDCVISALEASMAV